MSGERNLTVCVYQSYESSEVSYQTILEVTNFVAKFWCSLFDVKDKIVGIACNFNEVIPVLALENLRGLRDMAQFFLIVVI